MRLPKVFAPNQPPRDRQVDDEVLSMHSTPLNFRLFNQQVKLVNSQDVVLEPGEEHFEENEYLLAVPNNFGKGGSLRVVAGLVEGEEVVLGRKEEHGGIQSDPRISRKHAGFTQHGDFVRVRDYSTYGTWHSPDASTESSPDIYLPAGFSRQYELEIAGLKLSMAAMTMSAGNRPETNQDAYMVDGDSLGMGVFDGVGQIPGSALAAKIAAEVSRQRIADLPLLVQDAETAKRMMGSVLSVAHSRIVQKAKVVDEVSDKIASTGTIGKVLIRPGSQLLLAGDSVGDSRAGRFRDDRFVPFTLDQTKLMQRLGDEKRAMALQQYMANLAGYARLAAEMGMDEHEFARQNSMIYGVLGGGYTAPPVSKTFVMDLKPGDKAVFMTDGGHENFANAELEHILRHGGDEAFVLASAIIKQAKARSLSSHPRAKKDDITTAVLTVS